MSWTKTARPEQMGLFDNGDLSLDQSQRYLATKGTKCPYCGTDNIISDVSSAEITSYDGKQAWTSPVTCEECNKTWSDIFVFKGTSLDQREEARYLEGDRHTCPSLTCGDQLTQDAIDTDGDELWETSNCHGCNKHVQIYYKLMSVEGYGVQ